MTATLRLIPLSREECCVRLERKGKISLDALGSAVSSPSPATATADEYDRPRTPLALKLCEERHCNDVIEVDDDDDGTPEVVRYASRYQDGSIAAIISLGRNLATGIRWTAVSRALCDVSLTRASSSTSGGGGGKREVCMVDLDASPPGRADQEAPSATASGGSRRDDGGRNGSGPSGPPRDSDGVAAAAFLSMRKAGGKHYVFLDGELVRRPVGRETPLPNGSIISLYGPTGFAYEVEITQKEEGGNNSVDAVGNGGCAIGNTSPKKRKAISPADAKEEPPTRSKQRRDLRQRAHKLMVDEYTCAMCMDILVKSTFAIPCMHAFCEECSRTISSAVTPPNGARAQTNKGMCPTCRGGVEDWRVARSFDTIVWATALQGCFERDDAENYLERREECGEDAPTALEMECILNSTEGGSDGGAVKLDGGRNLYLPPNSSMQQPAMSFIRTLPPVFSTASNGSSNNVNNGGMVARKRPPNLGKSINDVICID